MWVINSEADWAVIDELKRMPDRAAGIIAAGFLEQSLEARLRAIMVDEPTLSNKFFKGLGPLSSFSAKIDLGYLLHQYSKEIQTCFHAIRKIRNEFAHDPSPLDFSTKKIADAAGGLLHPKKIAAAIEALGEEHKAETPIDAEMVDGFLGYVRQLDQEPDSIRARFMGSAQIGRFYLALLEALAKAENREMDSFPFSFWTPEPSPEKSE